jgi:hypothetical protein
MSILSTLLLYGGVFVAGGLGFVVACLLTSRPPETSPPADRPHKDDTVDPIMTIGF